MSCPHASCSATKRIVAVACGALLWSPYRNATERCDSSKGSHPMVRHLRQFMFAQSSSLHGRRTQPSRRYLRWMLAFCLAIGLAALTGAASAKDHGDAVGGKRNANSDSPALLADTAQINIGADLSLPEGDTGQTPFQFAVTLDQPQSAPVTVDYSTPNTLGTASPGSDYTATSGTLTFAPGETSKSITVQVNGDTNVEPDETFFVNLANPSGNATIGDTQAAATILNDDQAQAQINIGADLTLPEGDTCQTPFQVAVTLHPSPTRRSSDLYSTPNTLGTATPGSDYTATSGTLTFAPGETSKTITVQ